MRSSIFFSLKPGRILKPEPGSFWTFFYKRVGTVCGSGSRRISIFRVSSKKSLVTEHFVANNGRFFVFPSSSKISFPYPHPLPHPILLSPILPLIPSLTFNPTFISYLPLFLYSSFTPPLTLFFLYKDQEKFFYP